MQLSRVLSTCSIFILTLSVCLSVCFKNPAVPRVLHWQDRSANIPEKRYRAFWVAGLHHAFQFIFYLGHSASAMSARWYFVNAKAAHNDANVDFWNSSGSVHRPGNTFQIYLENCSNDTLWFYWPSSAGSYYNVPEIFLRCSDCLNFQTIILIFNRCHDILSIQYENGSVHRKSR